MKKLIFITMCTVVITTGIIYITAKNNNEYFIITKNNAAFNNNFDGSISKDLEIEFSDFEFKKIDLILITENNWKNYLIQNDAIMLKYQLTVKKEDFKCDGTSCTYKIDGIKKKYESDYIVLVADGKEDNVYVEFKRK